MRLFSLLTFLVTVSSVYAKSVVGDRILVVLEDSSEKALYSKFWADLEDRHYKLTFGSPKNDELSLFKLGELAFDHVILTPPKSKGYGPSLSPKILLDYTNAGGNILLGLSSESGTPSAISSLLLEFDIALPSDRTSYVVDHFNYDVNTATEKHNVLLVARPAQLRSDVVNFFGGDGLLALPNAVGQSLGSESALIAPILRAPSTAYLYNPKDETEAAEDIIASGSQLALISALQARNSARFTVLGSLEMLQDKWFGASIKNLNGKTLQTVNQEFARQLTEWTFREVGVLKVGDINHYEVTTSSKPVQNSTQVGFLNPDIYRIKNDVSFSIELSIYNQDHYEPFKVPPKDELQLEFSMLSPFQRIPLSPTSTTSNSTIFSATFQTPDQHGIFVFKVNYKRPFLTNVEEKRQVTVRHFAHDEWPRSWRITGAWPWIAGLWSVIGGFVAFVVLWLYCEPPDDETRDRAIKN